jgi:predicted transcriptional regulator
MDDIKQKVKFELEAAGIDETNQKLRRLGQETEETSKKTEQLTGKFKQAETDLKRMAAQYVTAAAAIALVKQTSAPTFRSSTQRWH